MALTVRLKSAGRKLPRCLVAFSAFLDMALTGKSYEQNKDTDPMFAGTSMKDIVELYTDFTNLEYPEISPMYADFSEFPPTFLTSDDNEVFVSDALKTAEMLDSCGVFVQCYITHDLIHAFEFEVPDAPESIALFKKIKQFIN